MINFQFSSVAISTPATNTPHDERHKQLGRVEREREAESIARVGLTFCLCLRDRPHFLRRRCYFVVIGNGGKERRQGVCDGDDEEEKSLVTKCELSAPATSDAH